MTGEHVIDCQWFSNTSRWRLQNLLADFASKVPANALVLDAGAGDQACRPLFGHANYESADFVQNGSTTYVGDLAKLPIEHERFDYIIFNQTLMYISDPQLVLKEFYRVIKAGGSILCTTPFFYEEDNEELSYDFGRYTRHALVKMFTSAGFEIVSTDRLEGYLTTLSYQLEGAFRHLPIKPSEIGSAYAYLLSPFFCLIKVFALFLAAILYRVDRLDGLCNFGYPKNYVVLARKKPGDAVKYSDCVGGAE